MGSEEHSFIAYLISFYSMVYKGPHIIRTVTFIELTLVRTIRAKREVL